MAGALAAAPSSGSGSGVRELEADCSAGEARGVGLEEGVAEAAGLALGTARS